MKQEEKVTNIYLNNKEPIEYYGVGFWLTIGVAFALSAIFVFTWVVDFIISRV